MTAEEAAELGKTLNFEKVWAAFTETDRKFMETDRKFLETDRKFAETDRKHAENEKLVKEVLDGLKRMEANVNRVSRNVGGLNRSIGELVETLIAARLWEKFPEYGLKRAYQRIPIYDEKNILKTDVDILLVNTDICMAVEVKHKLNRKDEIDDHLKRMRLIRQYPPGLVNDRQQLLGAMAGGVVDPDVKDYAYKSGFFVLELTGESVRLITPPQGFVPQKW
jgi:regulator of replication initiation timing